MTVRSIPTGSGTPPPPTVQQSPGLGDAPVTPSADAAATGAASAPVVDGRRTLREARRRRRRTAWLCVAVVAVCFGLAVLVVSLARDRPLPGPAVVSAGAAVRPAPVGADPNLPPSALRSSGAPAPEGAHP